MKAIALLSTCLSICLTIYSLILCLLTPIVHIELCPLLSTAGARLVLAMLLQAVLTEELPTRLVLKWVFGHFETNLALQGRLRLQNKHVLHFPFTLKLLFIA